MKNQIITHLPHSGIIIPSKYKKDYYLNLQELENNIIQYADYRTEELYKPFITMYDSVANPYSRLFMDPERFYDDNHEKMQQKYGLGWFYENAILEKKPLRTTKNKDKIRKYYIEHHRKLSQKVDNSLKDNGSCTIIDCHSFSNERYWFHDKNIELPDICIGYDEFHKDEKLVEILLNEFKEYTIGINTPYCGSLVPNKYYLKDSRVKSVMIEINKKLYLENDNITLSYNFYNIVKKIQNISNLLASDKK